MAERLRTMPLVRLSAPWSPYASRAAAARSVAQRLADLAADEGGWPRRHLPDVGDPAVGDQIAVTAADLLALAPGPDALALAEGLLRELRLAL